jgi:hypothetical protein
VPTGGDSLPDGLLPLPGELGVEVDLDVVAGQRRVQVGGPLGQAVPRGDPGELRLVAADEHRLGPDPVAGGGRDTAVVPDRQQGSDQMLAIPHPAGDAVDDDADRSTHHRSSHASDS